MLDLGRANVCRAGFAGRGTAFARATERHILALIPTRDAVSGLSAGLDQLALGVERITGAPVVEGAAAGTPLDAVGDAAVGEHRELEGVGRDRLPLPSGPVGDELEVL